MEVTFQIRKLNHNLCSLCGYRADYFLEVAVSENCSTMFATFCEKCIYFIMQNPYHDSYPLDLQQTDAFYISRTYGRWDRNFSGKCTKCKRNVHGTYLLHINTDISITVCMHCMLEFCSYMKVSIPQDHFITDVELGHRTHARVLLVYGVREILEISTEELLALEEQPQTNRWVYDVITPEERCSICLGVGVGARSVVDNNIIICRRCIQRLLDFNLNGLKSDMKELIKVLYALKNKHKGERI